jgi:cytochrome c biogenesis protein CcmG/thiol:disulfide interchange protein DsbE
VQPNDVPDLERRDLKLGLRLSRWLAGGAVALIATLAVLGLGAGPAAGDASGGPAPAFELPLLSGGSTTLADLEGRVAVVNVWASWCPPCREEAPVLRRLHEQSPADRVAFLGVVHQDSAADARGFVEDFDIAYPNVVDDGSFAAAYGVRGIPITFVIAADGTIAARHFGPIGESRLRALIEDALARSPQAGQAAR